MHRRTLLAIAAAGAAGTILQACRRRLGSAPVTLYSSIDPAVLEPIVKGLILPWEVKTLTDSEATKTTGLLARLQAEKSAPKADVWWSGEIVGTIQLARAGLLAPVTAPAVLTRYAGAVPRDPGGRWFPLADRPRVVVYNTAQFDAATRPRSLVGALDLARGSKSVKPVVFAMANPSFGTTRGHVAALYARLGRDAFAELFAGVKYRVVDGNSAVVRAVAMGEAALGLTDFDDLVSGQANRWPIDAFTPAFDPSAEAGPALMTPGTVGVLAGGPNPAGAQALAEVLLSEGTEDALAKGAWRSRPVVGASPATDARLADLTAAAVDWDKAVDALPEAVGLGLELMKG